MKEVIWRLFLLYGNFGGPLIFDGVCVVAASHIPWQEGKEESCPITCITLFKVVRFNGYFSENDRRKWLRLVREQGGQVGVTCISTDCEGNPKGI